MDKSKHAAKIQCTVCLEDFQVTFELTLCLLLNPGPGAVLTSFAIQATINFLSEPVDVYNEWIDACEAVNN